MTLHMSFEELHSIAETLASGFECLSNQISKQRDIEKSLRLHLQRAAEKYELLGPSGNSSSVAISDWRDDIERQNATLCVDTEPLTSSTSEYESVSNAKLALSRLRKSTMPSRMEVRKCPIAHKVPDQEDFERDFTVPGKPSDLGCPFAKGGKVASANSNDPVAAEFHGDKSSTRSQDAGSRCPIRFLDQHSPEEIAQYFENHKHEIPRSHQICVKRYQQDEHSIRQLDAKYGNIVSMIQGLGNKHKQYLPENERGLGDGEQISTHAVEKWAENISQDPAPEIEEDRVPRFEKSLRDVRVGESPSRPWGIPIPVEKTPPASVAELANAVQQQLQAPSSVAAPVISDAHANGDAKEQPVGTTSVHQRPQIVFNGPVFFGYTPEQAAVFLQQLQIPNKE